jgi:hypothetical protein
VAAEFAASFVTLKPVLKSFADRLAVTADTYTEYTLVTKRPFPFPQHSTSKASPSRN